jgi:hypothetical protein
LGDYVSSSGVSFVGVTFSSNRRVRASNRHESEESKHAIRDLCRVAEEVQRSTVHELGVSEVGVCLSKKKKLLTAQT